MYYSSYNSITEFMKKSRFVPRIIAMLFSISLAVITSTIYLQQVPPVADPIYSGFAEVLSVNKAESKAIMDSKEITIELFNSSVGDTVGVYSDNSLYTNNPLGHSASTSDVEAITFNFMMIVIGAALLGWAIGYVTPLLLQKRWMRHY